MSVVAILLHLSRAIIHAHNNAKVRNLMDAPPPEIRRDNGRHVSPDTSEKQPGAIHPGGR
ncbi:MAG: hypothetical protein E5W93_09350 [Mesorhizobium sp.]|nr:MAG: hypothetical protein E5W93_09350 [Mesorhizobium sp.]